MNININTVKIIVTIPLKNVIAKLREIHPYEELTIDIIPLIDEDQFI